MTVCGLLSTYIQGEWGLASPVGLTDIFWSTEWFNTKKITYPQITVTDFVSPIFERYKPAAGSLDMRHRDLFLINIWQRIRRGSSGTQEKENVEDMRREVGRILREGLTKNNWGGSLSPLRLALPLDDGIPRHQTDVEPRILRYELTLVATRDS